MEITTPNNVNYAPKTLTEALQIILLQRNYSLPIYKFRQTKPFALQLMD